ncbi:TraR/DksA family transcriptional regulator [Streptomyces sp. NPDC089919]|uniref:TraR/DksA family transcriptional regulator n=1 Tax=Streptomyces sp. NPDC089919 TaxID=3155188 RepID=UPI0034239CF0
MVAKKTAAKKTASAKTASAKKSSATSSAGGKSTAAGAAAAGPKKSTAAAKKGTAKAAAKKSATRTGAAPAAAKQAQAAPAAAQGAAQAAQETGAGTVVAKKSSGTGRASTARKTAVAATSGLPKNRGTAAAAGELAVRPGEDPWTPDEVADARAELESEVLRLQAELQHSEEAITGLMRDSGEGAGDDQADTGAKNITREHELSLASNAREMLEQSEHALERLHEGTYGLCENCGQPIGKARMQAFPRATLCVECKQKEERRH